jgi:hypothetical protein
VALQEFLRVPKPEGFAVITCPDLQSVCALVAEDKLTDAAYDSPAGPIAPLDIPSTRSEDAMRALAGEHFPR